jgi:hypothetical protein
VPDLRAASPLPRRKPPASPGAGGFRLPTGISFRYALRMTAETYPFKILGSFTSDTETQLKAAATRRGTSVRALLREYVGAGLAADRPHQGDHHLYRVPLTLADPIARTLHLVCSRVDKTPLDLIRNYVVLGLAHDLTEAGEIHLDAIVRTWTDEENPRD